VIACYLTHPQVDIEPARPVPLWRLSALGRSRVEAMRANSWLESLGRVVSSAETKAVETAAILAAHLGIPVEVEEDMGENDRSSTGFIEPAEFDAAADCFFAEPERSLRGWERAMDAADRIEAAANRVLKDAAKPVLMVGHGGVGTLLKCRIAGQPIARDRDQPPGGGNLFAFGIASRKLLCDWTPMESFRGVDDAG
jgi:broad specificity phosphatase PhoE